MSKRVIDRAEQFITEHSLHDVSEYTDLSILHNQFIPIYRSIPQQSIWAMGIFPAEVTEHEPARITIEEQLDESWRRMVYAHEIGHYICGHVDFVTSAIDDSTSMSRDERDAWIAAGALLIPNSAIGMATSEEDLIAETGVPPWLMDLYHGAIKQSLMY